MPTTKIVATLGPASREPSILRELIYSGVNVFRINASHAAKAGDITQMVNDIRGVAEADHLNVGVLLDLQGPKIRLGTFENGGCHLQTGSRFTITTKTVVGNCEGASTVYADFAKDVRPGDRVLLFTDGITEVRDANGEEFAEERLINLLIANRHLDAAALQAIVMQTVARFSGGEFQDDATLIALSVE